MSIVKLKVTFLTFILGGLLNINIAYTQELTAAKPHMVSCPKLLIGDLAKAQSFYEEMFGMKVLLNFSQGTFAESIMSFGGERTDLILFAPDPSVEPPLEKSEWPMMVLYTPEFDALVERLKKASANYKILDFGEQSGLAVEDPSGNWLEIISRPGQYELAGAKMIVDDLAVAETFYSELFGAEVKEHFEIPETFKEVILEIGDGPMLALYESYNDSRLTNSQFPVTFFQTIDLDSIVTRVEQAGYEHTLNRMDGAESGPSAILVVTDPGGNWIEIGLPLENGF